MHQYKARIEIHALEETANYYYQSDDLEKVIAACKALLAETIFDYKERIEIERRDTRTLLVWELQRPNYKRRTTHLGTVTIDLYSPPHFETV